MERHRRNGGKETSPKCRIRRDGAAGPGVNNFRTVAAKWRKLWQRRAISTKVCKYAGRWDNSQRPFTMPVQESSPKGEDDWKRACICSAPENASQWRRAMRCARAITMPVQESSPKGEDDWKRACICSAPENASQWRRAMRCARAITMPVQESSPKGEDDWKQIISTTYRNFYVKTGKITEDIADSVIKIIYNIVGEVGNRKFNILVL